MQALQVGMSPGTWNESIGACRRGSACSGEPLQEKAARGGTVALAHDVLAGIKRLDGSANALERVLLVIRENEVGFQLVDERGGVEGLRHGLLHAVVTGERVCLSAACARHLCCRPLTYVSLAGAVTGEATFVRAKPFRVWRASISMFSWNQVIQDPEGIDFANLEAAISEATAGARDLVAHGIMQNEDVSGQVFLIRDGNGEVVATVPFRATLPGRLRG